MTQPPLVAAVAALLAICACSSEDVPAGPDAGPPELAARIAPVTHRIKDFALRRNGSELVYCADDHTVGFVDTTTLGEVDAVDVGPLGRPDDAIWLCRVSLIGDEVYALYVLWRDHGGDDYEPNHRPSWIVKLSLSSRSLVNAWRLPDELACVTFEQQLLRYEGVQPTTVPGIGVVGCPRLSDETTDGVDLVYVDLNSGSAWSDQLVSAPDIARTDILRSIDNDRIYGRVRHGDTGDSTTFVASLSRGELLWSQSAQEPYFVDIDPDGERLLYSSALEAEWSIRRLSDGATVRESSFDLYLVTDQRDYMVFAPGERLIHVLHSGRGSRVTLLDEQSLSTLARTTFIGDDPDVWFSNVAFSPDGRLLYGAGDHTVVELALP